MYKAKRILAIIPARGGSKGVPRKNIKKLLGEPLIAWTIREARQSAYLDKIIVSSDDREIIGIAERYGAEAPFVRPLHLATDKAKTIDVVLHALRWFYRHGEDYDLILVLPPTSPLRTAGDIDHAIRLLFLKRAQAVVSVCLAEYHPWWAGTLTPDGRMVNFGRNKVMNKRRQELPVFYRLNGAIYLIHREYLKKVKGFIGKQTYAYIMPQERSVDIDTVFDFRLAQALMRKEL